MCRTVKKIPTLSCITSIGNSINELFVVSPRALSRIIRRKTIHCIECLGVFTKVQVLREMEFRAQSSAAKNIMKNKKNKNMRAPAKNSWDTFQKNSVAEQF